MLRLVAGHKYTTTSVIKYGDLYDLKKIAKKENRNYKRQGRVERLVVYPVSGPMIGIGQLCILR